MTEGPISVRPSYSPLRNRCSAEVAPNRCETIVFTASQPLLRSFLRMPIIKPLLIGWVDVQLPWYVALCEVLAPLWMLAVYRFAWSQRTRAPQYPPLLITGVVYGSIVVLLARDDLLGYVHGPWRAWLLYLPLAEALVWGGLMHSYSIAADLLSARLGTRSSAVPAAIEGLLAVNFGLSMEPMAVVTDFWRYDPARFQPH